ncbi:HNH endonuclease [Kiritimatiellaeota bacterium B1221]|nr:HNH endonuclease [Kiritimatiellaeota bacterium B1221]
MDSVLEKNVVLVLNRNWQAINTTTPAHAFCQMAAGNALGLDMDREASMYPVDWDKWRALPVRDYDWSIGVVRGQLRVPRVILSTHYGKVPMRHPKFSYQAIRDRDNGRCQYTGRKLGKDEGNIDHVVPRSKGGATSWSNCVLSCKRVNNRKGDRSPHEAGLRLLKDPETPKVLPMTLFLQNVHEIPEWEPFLIQKKAVAGT